MPIYIYKCPKCDRVEEHMRSISNRLNHVTCPYDGAEMPLKIRAPAFKMGAPGVVDRLNANYKIRQERKAKGEFVGEKDAM